MHWMMSCGAESIVFSFSFSKIERKTKKNPQRSLKGHDKMAGSVGGMSGNCLEGFTKGVGVQK